MDKNNLSREIKNTGATFTPTELADFLSKKILKSVDSNKDNLIVYDPSCGSGALLLSIQKLMDKNNISGSLKGYDTNIQYLQEAQQLFNKEYSNSACSVDLINADFLEVSTDEYNLFSSNHKREYADIIIANPPYVRTQNLGSEQSQKIAKQFGLKGKIDLYYPFIIGMTNILKEGGILGVITSNRYLTTKSGADIRKFLRDNYEIIEIIDLGDTKLFDAAVLPAIFIGKKKKSTKIESTKCKFVKIYESEFIDKAFSTTSIFEILEKEKSGIYTIERENKFYKLDTDEFILPKQGADIWQMSTNQENKWINIINKNADFLVGDKFKVRVGVKSCADKIFIKTKWNKEENIPEDIFFRPLISQDNIQKWHIDSENMLRILYPHISINGKKEVLDIEKYPKAKLFFNKYKEQLTSREYLIASNRKWYEFWVPQNPDLWKYPKLVFPDISIDARFSYDDSGAIVNGNCYWIVAENDEEQELLLLIQGIANSELIGQYHDICFNNKLYSGRRRYLSQYIEKYPIPDPTSLFSKEIIESVKVLNKNHLPQQEKEILTEKINFLVKKAFCIED